MAKTTTHQARSLSIYQVFPRNYSQQGTLNQVQADLDRIAKMGFDYLYLLPIHPIGQDHRKGDLGSPYAIQNYRTINPEYGTMEDFLALIKSVHQHNMKIMMDLVLNHTSPDHVYVSQHPEYYYKKQNGKMGNRVGDWTDVVDLDFSCRELRAELIDMMCSWVSLGVDGFRCDVASLIPLDFWIEARQAVAKLNPNHFWLAESIEHSFISTFRSTGFDALTDSELYQVFDCCYDYDLFDSFKSAIVQKESLMAYKQRVVLQETTYPENYCKARFLENHDQPRIYGSVLDKKRVMNWVAYSYFVKGLAFVYAGQEAWNTHQNSLFTQDLVNWDELDPNYEQFLKRCSEIKKMDFMQEHRQVEMKRNQEEILLYEYQTEQEIILGIFNVRTLTGSCFVTLQDGHYQDLLNNSDVEVRDGKIELSVNPMILYKKIS